MKMAVVAGLESNFANNVLKSIPYSEAAQTLPHTLPHIFVHISLVRFSFSAIKLNISGVRDAGTCDFRGRLKPTVPHLQALLLAVEHLAASSTRELNITPSPVLGIDVRRSC